MTITAYITRAFCRKSQGGNPAGVVLLDRKMPPLHLQKIAAFLNFSETIFLAKKTEHCYQALYYTPTSSIDFCGHASIAAFGVLHQLGLLSSTRSSLETQAGMCSISIDDPFIFLKLPLPLFGEYISEEEVAAFLGIDAASITGTELRPQIVSTGLKDIIVPVINEKALLAIRPDHEQISFLSEKYDVIGMHIFALDPTSKVTAYCRNFAPRYGIPEESATGSSNGALACYLFMQNVIEEKTLLFQQGDILNSPSEIHVRLTTELSKIEMVECGGEVLIDKIITVKLPEN
jgi:PhzF family phenazine biosynthesis protein